MAEMSTRGLRRSRLGGMLSLGIGSSGLLWWILVWTSPTVRSWFDADRARWWLDGFALADIALFVVGHIIVGALTLMQRGSGRLPVFVLGATTYALLSCIGMLRYGGGVAAVVAMSCACAGSGLACWLVGEPM